MNEPNLLLVCTAAMFAVFVLLGALAVLMRILTTLYPEQTQGPDAALLAAISSAAAVAYPGTVVSRVEEIR